MNPRLGSAIDRLLATADGPPHGWLELLVASGACRSVGLARRRPGATTWTSEVEIDPRRELQDPDALHPDPVGPLPTALPSDRLLVQVPGPDGERLLQLAGWDPAVLDADEVESLMLLATVLRPPPSAPALPTPSSGAKGEGGGTGAARSGLAWLLEHLGKDLAREERTDWERGLSQIPPRKPS
ncbi:MAG: hypothetical protein IPJ77_03705 [Planctomycetes bacterium]|nr:hypothetical protein [Planctomycetota bacterium]